MMSRSGFASSSRKWIATGKIRRGRAADAPAADLRTVTPSGAAPSIIAPSIDTSPYSLTSTAHRDPRRFRFSRSMTAVVLPTPRKPVMRLVGTDIPGILPHGEFPPWASGNQSARSDGFFTTEIDPLSSFVHTGCVDKYWCGTLVIALLYWSILWLFVATDSGGDQPPARVPARLDRLDCSLCPEPGIASAESERTITVAACGTGCGSGQLPRQSVLASEKRVERGRSVSANKRSSVCGNWCCAHGRKKTPIPHSSARFLLRIPGVAK